MPQGTRVLVVDAATDTTEVLQAVLSPRGVDVQRTVEPSHDLPAPEVVVIDSETGVDLVRRFAGVPRIILGRTARADTQDCRVLAKPFHYADLVRAIEQVITSRLPVSRSPGGATSQNRRLS